MTLALLGLAAAPSAQAQTTRPVATQVIRPQVEDTQPVDGEAGETDAPQAPAAEAAGPLPQFDLSQLPEPVARMRAAILRAAVTGDIEALRPVIESNELPPLFSYGEISDPIVFLKNASGDADGYEILAVLTEILDAGYVRINPGTDQELYVWPWFAEWPLEALSPSQTVQLLTLVTASDLETMRQFGAYIFWRVGIGPDGTWHYFIAGD